MADGVLGRIGARPQIFRHLQLPRRSTIWYMNGSRDEADHRDEPRRAAMAAMNASTPERPFTAAAYSRSVALGS